MNMAKSKDAVISEDNSKQPNENMDSMLELANALNSDCQSPLPVQIKDIPNELLIKIFEYLPHGDLQQVRTVCKRWNNLTQLPEFLDKSKLIINRDNISVLYQSLKDDPDLASRLVYDSLELHGLELSDDLHKILQCLGGNIRNLLLYKSSVFALLNDSLPDLEELAVSRIPTVQSDNTFLVNLSKFKRFKSLDISCVNVTNYIKTHMILNLTRDPSFKIEKLSVELNREHEELLVYTLQCHGDSLQYLEIILRSVPTMIGKWKQVFVSLTRLETLKITGVSCYVWLKTLVDCLPKQSAIRHCDLSGGLQVDNALLQTVVNKWHASLENLDLMFCNSLTNQGLQHLKKLRPTLKSLNLSHCSKITLKGLLLGIAEETNTVLRSLVINDICDADADSLVILAQRLPQLTYLSLENCRDCVTDSALESIFRHQTRLQHLVLNECLRITDEGLIGYGPTPASIQNLKGLQTLCLRGCRNLSNRALMKGLKFLELRKLILGYCHKITSMGIEELVENCPAIEDLTISSCLMIDDDAMLLIAQGLPRLRRLNVSNCLNLTSRSIDYVVELCRSLKELSMCGIDSLEIQEVQEKFLHMKPQILELNL